MKPIQQIFALVIESIPSYKRKVPSFRSKMRKVHKDFADDSVKLVKKESDLRNKTIKEFIFESYLVQCRNMAQNNRLITEFFNE